VWPPRAESHQPLTPQTAQSKAATARAGERAGQPLAMHSTNTRQQQQQRRQQLKVGTYMTGQRHGTEFGAKTTSR